MNRRELLGTLAAVLALPLLRRLREADPSGGPPPSPPPPGRPRIAPPSHSVKRHA